MALKMKSGQMSVPTLKKKLVQTNNALMRAEGTLLTICQLLAREDTNSELRFFLMETRISVTIDYLQNMIIDLTSGLEKQKMIIKKRKSGELKD